MDIIQKGNLYVCENLGFTIRIDQTGPPLVISLFKIVYRLTADDQDNASFLVYTYTGAAEKNLVTTKIENAEVFCEVVVSDNGDLITIDPPTIFSDREELDNWHSVLARIYSIAIDRIAGVEFYVNGAYRDVAPGPEYQIAEDGSEIALGYTERKLKYLREDGSFH